MVRAGQLIRLLALPESHRARELEGLAAEFAAFALWLAQDYEIQVAVADSFGLSSETGETVGLEEPPVVIEELSKRLNALALELEEVASQITAKGLVPSIEFASRLANVAEAGVCAASLVGLPVNLDAGISLDELRSAVPTDIDLTWLDEVSRLTTQDEELDAVVSPRLQALVTEMQCASALDEDDPRLVVLQILWNCATGKVVPVAELTESAEHFPALGLPLALLTQLTSIRLTEVDTKDEEIPVGSKDRTAQLASINDSSAPRIEDSDKPAEGADDDQKNEVAPDGGTDPVVKAASVPESADALRPIRPQSKTEAASDPTRAESREARSSVTKGVGAPRSEPHLPITEVEAMPAAADGTAETDATALIAHQITSSHLSTAYWIARTDGRFPEDVTPAILAVIASRSASAFSDKYMRAVDDAINEWLDCDEPSYASSLLVASAALRAMTKSHGGSLQAATRVAIRKIETRSNEVAELIRVAEPRLMDGTLISAGASHSAVEMKRLLKDREKLRIRAVEAKDTWPKEKTNYMRATTIWRDWSGSNGPLGRLLVEVASKSPDLDKIAQLSTPYSEQKLIASAIDAAAASEKLKRKRIESTARQWLLEHVQRVVDLAGEVASNIKKLEAVKSQGGRGKTDVAADFQARVSRVQNDFSDRSSNTELERAAESVFLATLQELDPIGGAAIDDPSLDLDPDDAAAYGLIVSTNLSTSIDFEETLERLGAESTIAALVAGAEAQIEVAWDARFAEGDHRSTGVLLHRMRLDDHDPGGALDRSREQDMESRRRDLITSRSALELRLARFLRGELLEQAEHDALSSSTNTPRSDDVLDFPADQRKRAEIKDTLDAKKALASEIFHAELNALRLADADADRLRSEFESERFDVASELLQRISEGESMPSRVENPIALEAFLNFTDVVRANPGRAKELLEDGAKSLSSFGVGDLDPETVKAAVLAETQFTKVLKKLPNVKKEDFSRAMRLIGTALGIDVVAASISIDRGISPKISHIRFKAAPIGADWVPPIFGSRAGAVRDGAPGDYSLIVAHGSVSEAELVRVVHQRVQGSESATFIFSVQPLTVARRQELAAQSRREGTTFLLVDSMTLLFLPIGRAMGLSPFDTTLATTLPFTFINPYVMHGAVPREMFFGRAREREGLIDPSGTCFVYGGRQLGKSALLKDVQRRTSEPKRGRISVLIDLSEEGVGDTRPNADIWEVIAAKSGIDSLDGLHERDSIVKGAKSWLEEDSARRCYLLLDESDRFLERESDPEIGFTNVVALRNLMNETDRRFKVVFAGLHSVQRFWNIPNQPFAQFGQTSPIGPLGWAEATELITQPLHAAGYRFEPADLVNQILVETRRHPSLLQIACRGLIEHVARRRQRAATPVKITAADINELFYRSPDIGRKIKERFEWTLDLDPRYRALGLILANRSIESRGVRDAGMTESELWADAIEWWPQAFSGLDRARFGVLLDEMHKLEVFAYDQRSRYRLPVNVVRLFGEQDMIEERLLDLHELEVVDSLDKSRLRRAVGSTSEIPRSPFTHDDEKRLLREDGPPIRVVFGSRATGIELALEAIRACKTERGYEDVNFRFRDGDSISDVAEALSKHAEKDRRLILINRLRTSSFKAPADGGTLDVLAQLQNLAENVSRTPRPQSVAVLVVDDRLLSVWPDIADFFETESEICTVTTLSRWGRQQLRAWSDEIEIPVADDEALGSIQELTGGWPVLVEEFGRKAVEAGSVLEAVQQLRDSPEFDKALLSAIDLSELSFGDLVLDAAHEYEEEISVPEMVELLRDRGPAPTEVLDAVSALADLRILDRGANGFRINGTFRRCMNAPGITP